MELDVLLTTCDRPEPLILTLSGLAAQSFTRFHLIVADQSPVDARSSPVVRSLLRIIEYRGASVTWCHRRQVNGIAEQRQFLLDQATSPFVLYLDDDVFLEPSVLQHLLDTIRREECGFVGAFPVGLSFLADRRPEQQVVEYWDGPVWPEVVEPGSPAWQRAQLHRAANPAHAAEALQDGEQRLYKTAWVASCVLYDREKLLSVGGFRFWNRLPRFHAGEEVVVQNLLMRRYGGCCILPSGAYHAEVASTVLNDAGTVDGHALDLLPDLINRYT